MKTPTHKIGLAGALFSASIMLILSIANALGLYQNATQMMEQWHMFYTPTVTGTITGMIEASIITYLGILLFVWIYTLILGQKKN